MSSIADTAKARPRFARAAVIVASVLVLSVPSACKQPDPFQGCRQQGTCNQK